MLPAAQLPNTPYIRIENIQVTAIALAKYSSFHMGGLQFSTRLNQLPLVIKQELRNVERTIVSLTGTDRQEYSVIAGSLRQSLERLTAHHQAILMVLLKVADIVGGRGEPGPPGIAGEPAFRKRDQFGTFLGCVFNHGDALIDTAFEVHEYRGGLHNRGFKFDAHLLFLIL